MFQSSDVVKLLHEQCCFFVVTGSPSVLESPADSDDLFNLELVRTATVDVVSYSCEGGEEGLVDRLIVGEWDSCLHSTEWLRLNWGACMYGWRYVFLVRVIEFTGSGFVWVREADTGDIGGPVFVDPEESCDPLLDSGVLLLHVYWTFGSI